MVLTVQHKTVLTEEHKMVLTAQHKVVLTAQRKTYRQSFPFLIPKQSFLILPQTHTRMLIGPWPDQEVNKLGSMSGTRAISTTLRRELSPSFFFPLQGKAPKEIHAILTETLTCFLPVRAKDLSAPLYF